MKKKIAIAAALVGALLAAIGYGYKSRYAMSIGIIGGADGPTAIFVAGKTGLLFYAGVALFVLAVIALIVMIRRRKK